MIHHVMPNGRGDIASKFLKVCHSQDGAFATQETRRTCIPLSESCLCEGRHQRMSGIYPSSVAEKTSECMLAYFRAYMHYDILSNSAVLGVEDLLCNESISSSSNYNCSTETIQLQ